jgi:radical SAM superfamily enzyme YgiQ (UPF0313 family)
MRPSVILVDLPTFPKGTASLSLPYLAAILGKRCDVLVLDMNFISIGHTIAQVQESRPVLVGLKVSSQNLFVAKQLTEALKSRIPSCKTVWGGEFPSLMPDEAAAYADCVVSGLFDIVADEFISDLLQDALKPRYDGKNTALPEHWTSPDWSGVTKHGGYNRFMGLPLETSRGCTESCTFCMVLVMQRKHYHTRPLEIIAADVKAIGRNHINIIDYNFGVSADHVKEVCAVIERSEALGFMAEMCIDLLDNDEVLESLKSARCRMIYCGLESIEQNALKSVGKDRTNHIDNYRRIIAKAHANGIRIASGFILGMDGSNLRSYMEAQRFFEEVGIMYVKLTFLTFNPGTRSKTFYEKKGRFLTSEVSYYDGNHLTFLPEGVSEHETLEGTRWFIRNFYSMRAILARAWVFPDSNIGRLAFVLFNLCYRQVYLDWMSHDRMIPTAGPNRSIDGLYRRPWSVRVSESILLFLWKRKPAL